MYKRQIEFDWVPIEGPAGNTQWEPRAFPDGNQDVPEGIMMCAPALVAAVSLLFCCLRHAVAACRVSLPFALKFHLLSNRALACRLTSDIAFIRDPAFRVFVEEYAVDLAGITADFAAAWYQLTTQDMGPVSRCSGPDVPPAQPFQDPLPDGGDTCDEESMTDLMAASDGIRSFIQADPERFIPLFSTIAYNCAATFRATSFSGGCNGARILFPPQVRCPPAALGCVSLCLVTGSVQPVLRGLRRPASAPSICAVCCAIQCL